jgi:hypothetical protein
MGKFFQVDLDNLHRLGATLGGHADAIGGLKLTAKVEMPGSPVQGAADQVSDGVGKAFDVIGKNIRQMANACTNVAATYEEADRVFSTQRDQYLNGR